MTNKIVYPFASYSTRLMFLAHTTDKLLFIVLSSALNSVLKLMFHVLQDSGHQKGYEQFDTALMGLLRRILDTNKRVQEAACSAFATLEEVVINLLYNLLHFRI